MISLKCPVCGGILLREEKTVRCGKGHSFDIARQGYVNLLMSNKTSAKRHGDDKLMVAARRSFLEKGYYDPLRKAIADAAVGYTAGGVRLLDAGCGEGWYTAGVKEAIQADGRDCEVCGIDISREALIAASKRLPGSALAVAGINAVPLPDGAVDLLLNIFAPNDDVEFSRVLAPGGVLIRAVPGVDHLMGLKSAVYERPYLNPEPEYAPDGFSLLEKTEIKDRIVLRTPEDVRELFMMTPYYYKTGREDQRKLFALETLETEISFCLFVLRKMEN